MSFFERFFKGKNNLPVVSSTKISESYDIPEPTKSLLFVTNEDVSKISSPHQIKLTITLTNHGAESKIDDGHNFFGEPSLIWTRLPTRKNNDLETKPMYYPAYSSLTPENRYQYLTWLKDITQPTNLSYVFLYYYGLERHLLTGNFDISVREILKLLSFHNNGTFINYAKNALIVSSLHKNRPDIFEKNHFLLTGHSNESLVMRKIIGDKLRAKELIELSSFLGFKNKRYIKLYPEDFEKELDKLIVNYEYKNGSLLEAVSLEELEQGGSVVFANYSLPDKIRSIKIPQLITNQKFKNICFNLLKNTHHNLKG